MIICSHTGGGQAEDTARLAASILSRPNGIDGVSVSGGEPFQQPEALLDLFRRLAGSGLSLLAFSGYTLAEIRNQPLGPEILSHLDVLVAGRYSAPRHLGAGLLGSTNQQIHLLTPRHSPEEFASVPTTEIILHPDGSLTLTGISPPKAPPA